MVAAMRVGHEAFAAIRGPFDRAADLAGGPGDNRLLGVVVDFRAEPAADVRRHHAQLVFRNVQHERTHQQPDHVRVLTGGIEREVARGGVEIADCRARLHGVRDQPVVDQVEFYHARGAGEHTVHHRLVADVPIVTEVSGHAVMHFRGTRRDRVRQVGDGRQVGVVDLDQLRGVFRLLLGRRDHHRDRVSDMAHLVDREHRMRRFGHRRAILVMDLPTARQAADAFRCQVSADKDAHYARRRRGGCGLDAIDRRMRPISAFDDGVKLAGTVDIVGVIAAAAEKAHVLLAADGRTNAFEAHFRLSLLQAALYSAALACISGCAAAIALTMLW